MTADNTPAKKAEPHVRIAELITLQRRLLKTIDAQTKLVTTAAAQAETANQRAVDKLIRVDADRGLFMALQNTVWDAVGSGPLLTLLKDTAACDAAAKLQKDVGSKDNLDAAFAKDTQKALTLRIEQEKLEAERTRLSDRLQVVAEFNENSRTRIDLSLEKKFKESGFFARMSWTDSLNAAYKIYSTYNSKHSQLPSYKVDMFDDMNRRAELDARLAEIATQQRKIMDAQLKRAATIADYEGLAQNMEKGPVAPRYDALRDELCRHLEDQNFLMALTRHTPSGFAGPLILTALKASALKDVAESLNKLHEDALETLGILEGPVLELARAQNRLSAVEIVEQDAEVLAALGGYTCINAAALVSALDTFQPDHVDGAQIIAP